MPSRSPRTSRASSSAPLTLTGGPLTIDDVAAVARHDRPVVIGREAQARMAASRAVVERALSSDQALYGINTGFGSLSRQRIDDADLAALQRNLVRSHSAGVCEPLPDSIVRGMMLLLAASLCRGLSGVRPVVAQTVVEMLCAGITPVVPSVGSVGASGDLAPLAAVALAAIGEGEVFQRSPSVSERPFAAPRRTIPAAVALKRAGIKPLALGAKEGLALINGTHLMAAEGALLATDVTRLLEAAAVACAMSIDACRASHAFLDERLYVARNNAAAQHAAGRLATLLEGSAIRESHRTNDPRVQDPYSLRAAPTVLGAVLEAICHVAERIEDELGAVTDNPLVFPRKGKQTTGNFGGEIVSGANFHGAPLAVPLDYLAIALCHLAGIAERRIYLMTGAFDAESGLRPFLTPTPGLRSGLMIAQYTAAACVNEMAGLATPASVTNVATSAGMEDYNSFGPRSAAKARRAVELAENVVAIELLCAAQGLEFHRPLRSGSDVERAHRAIRRVVKALDDDRPLTRDIEAIVALIRAGSLI
jgi:histidine ammonia-lyase